MFRFSVYFLLNHIFEDVLGITLNVVRKTHDARRPVRGRGFNPKDRNMNLGKKIPLLTCLCLLVSALVCPLAAALPELETDYDFGAALYFSYNKADVELGPNSLVNPFSYHYLVMEVNAELFDMFTVGVLAGFNQNNFDDPVVFDQLPLSLQLTDAKPNAFVLGANIKSEFATFGYFSLKAKGEFLYFSSMKFEDTIDLPIVSGSAIIKNNFYQFTVDLLLQYDGFSGVSIFLGPQVFLLDGTMSADETISSLEANHELDFNQKQVFGITGGASIAVASNFDLVLKATMLSKLSLSAGIVFIF